MDSVEILQYFTEMATKFDGSAVLREARSLLYKFRQLNKIPCTLRGIMSNDGGGVWDGGILPEIECVSHNRRCCKDSKRSDDSLIVDGEECLSEVDSAKTKELTDSKIITQHVDDHHDDGEEPDNEIAPVSKETELHDTDTAHMTSSGACDEMEESKNNSTDFHPSTQNSDKELCSPDEITTSSNDDICDCVVDVEVDERNVAGANSRSIEDNVVLDKDKTAELDEDADSNSVSESEINVLAKDIRDKLTVVESPSSVSSQDDNDVINTEDKGDETLDEL